MKLNLNEMLYLNKDQYSKEMYARKKDEIYKDIILIETYIENHNTKGLFAKYEEYRMQDTDHLGKDLQTAIGDMNTFYEKIEGNNIVFLRLYIIGSVLLAVSFILKKIKYLSGSNED